MKKTLTLSLVVGLAACAAPERPSNLDPAITAQLESIRGAPVKPRPNPAIEQALIPPMQIELPRIDGKALEPRFDLTLRQAPAQQVFMSIVSGTRYSMLIHPDVTGIITVSLKDVTVKEALDSLRQLYGYEYQIEGTRIFVQPIALQTRVFRVSYLIGQRQGRTDISVRSGISGQASTGGAGGGAGQAPTAGGVPGGQGAGAGSNQAGFGAMPGTSTQVATVTRTDFWSDLKVSLRSIVGVSGPESDGSPAPQQSTGLAGVPPGTTTGSAASGDIGGRSVVVNAQAGIVVVRAMPREMRAVEDYLRTLRLSVERQVMLEAKIVEVTLGDGYQAGINWGAFPSGRFAGGLLNPDTSLGVSGSLTGGALTGNPSGRALTSQPGTGPGTFPMGNGSLLGLALQTSNFAALISFLESQGSVQVLSSPRIAALNNQKAVLKVGTEEFFATNVSGGSSSTSTGSTTPTTQLPTLTVQPFFSGIALDVLPQIDDDGSVILHVRPTVSNVEQDNRTFSLGTQFGQITLPLAKSTASETDSIVRVTDGNIVAIGGLMRIDAVDQRSGIPGTSESVVSGLTGSRRRTVVKREMVVLIKPTVIRTDAEMAEDARQTMQRMEGMMGRPGFVTVPSVLR